jgi:hypothetical protein
VKRLLGGSIILLASLVFISCSEKDGSGGGMDKIYDFTSTVTGVLKSASLAPSISSDVETEANTFCSSVFCATPSDITGKYFATGLLIQSNGSGLSAYFGQTSWSQIDANSPMYNFSLSSPVSNSGNLFCCAGSGDLAGANTYYSDVSYLMAYMDITFTLTSGMGVHGAAVGTHTVRVIVANGAIAGASRGDLLYKDTDNAFKWMDSTNGTLTTTRPSSPVQMDSAVTNYVNPFGPSAGNQEIPVIYAGLNSTDINGGPLVVSETDLRTNGKTYEFYFNAENLIIFPTIIKNQDEGMISSLQTLLTKFHIQGLPYTGSGLIIGTTPSAPNTTLNIY